MSITDSYSKLIDQTYYARPGKMVNVQGILLRNDKQSKSCNFPDYSDLL